jgi:hypothetical protein
MHRRSVASHTIRIRAPIDRCQRFFTPAGEELWVDGWRPTYLYPADGRTEPGMVFTTGEGDAFTIWTLLDFNTTTHYARYARVTPTTRTGLVEVRCNASEDGGTDVEVTYAMTALSQEGVNALEAYEGQSFVNMIKGWKVDIDARLPTLLITSIR